MSNQVDVISFPREIAEAACWLASDASIMCTGSVLVASGGRTIYFRVLCVGTTLSVALSRLSELGMPQTPVC